MPTKLQTKLRKMIDAAEHMRPDEERHLGNNVYGRYVIDETKALSIKQPWAWLIVNGYKDIENRDWPTKHRGRFLVHASKTFDDDGHEWVKSQFPDIPLPEPNDYEFGGVIGEAAVVNCVSSSQSPWFVGKYGFCLADAKPLPYEPLRGRLQFFTAKEEHALLIYCKWESTCLLSDAISAVNNAKRVLTDLHGGEWGAKHHGFQRGTVPYQNQKVNVNGYRVTWWAEEAAGIQEALV